MKSLSQTEPMLVAVEEAARLMAISRSQFYRELAAGRIEARKAGKRTLVPMTAIRGWLQALPVSNAA